MTDIFKEISALKSAINMGRKGGRQKAIEAAFNSLEKAMAEPAPTKLSLTERLKRYWRITEEVRS